MGAWLGLRAGGVGDRVVAAGLAPAEWRTAAATMVAAGAAAAVAAASGGGERP